MTIHFPSTSVVISCCLAFLFMTTGCRETRHDHHHHHEPAFRSQHEAVRPTPVPDQIILNLTPDPLTSVAVNWRTDTTVKEGEVRLALATHGPEFRREFRTIKAVTESFSNQYNNEPEVNAFFHSAVIDRLEAGELYVYQVGSDTLWSEWFQIRMPDSDELSFIYFGDAQNDVKSMWSRVIREAYAAFPRIDFMLHAGDLINRHNRDLDWAEWFGAGGFIHSMIPSVMTPGNHEYGKGVILSPQWKAQFNLPRNGPPGLEETCYYITYPQLKVISLDAEQIDESDFYRDAQKVWLDSVLKNNQSPWVAVTLHYPVFSTKAERDNVELREHFKPVFDRYKVDIVLQGHDHAYGRGTVSNVADGLSTREKSTGTVYVVSVSGPKMYDVTDDPWMARRAGNTQLFQFISIKGNKLTYQAFTAAGELYDAFEIQKSKSGINKVIEKIPEMAERVEVN